MDQVQGDALPATKFQIFSGLLKASRSADGRMRLHGVASSTTKDLHGDTMEASAIEDMERAANNNLTIFLNHSYEVPEDVAGSVESARMKTRGVSHTGDPNYDLDMDILINDANPRAVKAFEAIERGTKLGLSIGALIPEGGARKEKGGAYKIDHVELLETSLVGIPANPRSWVEYAAKSLRGVEKDAVTVPIGQPTLTLDGGHYRIEGSVDGLTLSNGKSTTNTVIDSVADAAPEPDITDAAKCADCEEGDPCGKHKAIEPDITDATVTLIQIDTDDSSSSSDAASSDASAPQDGPETNPDMGDEDYAASGEPELTASLTGPAITRMVEMLESTTRELVEAKRIAHELTIEKDALVRERDDAVQEKDRVLSETKRVLDQLADTPLMRRAVVANATRDLEERVKGVYSDDFLKMLRSPSNG